jgi:uncharacterized membrane protein (DUF373 family)
MIAVLFLAAAVAMGVYSVITFFQHINDDFPLDIITSINDLLLVLIILEVLGTVRSYLVTGTTSLTPFLYIGIISATRRILAIGAATTLGEATSESDDRPGRERWRRPRACHRALPLFASTPDRFARR